MGGSLYYINYTLICILHEGTQLRMGPHLERDMSNIITTYIKMVEKWSYLLSTYVRISFLLWLFWHSIHVSILSFGLVLLLLKMLTLKNDFHKMSTYLPTCLKTQITWYNTPCYCSRHCKKCLARFPNNRKNWKNVDSRQFEPSRQFYIIKIKTKWARQNFAVSAPI